MAIANLSTQAIYRNEYSVLASQPVALVAIVQFAQFNVKDRFLLSS